MLPITIKDYDTHDVPGEFFVMNPLDVVDCIDREASAARLNLIDPTTIMTCEQLVLRDIPEEEAVLRPSMWPSACLSAKTSKTRSRMRG